MSYLSTMPSETSTGQQTFGTIRAEWLVLFSVCFATCGQLLLKHGLTLAKIVSSVSHPAMVLILMGFLIYGLGTLLWIAAVSKQEISYLYPLSALNYLLVPVGGAVLLREHISPLRWVGILTMGIGIAFLVWSRRDAAAEGLDR